jgi:CRP-like cAMP-binding protein
LITKAINHPTPFHTATQRSFACAEIFPIQSQVLWKIEHGIVRTFTYNEAGTRSVLGYWGQEDVVGLPLSRLSPYEIECITDVKVSVLPQSSWQYAVEAILSHNQQIEELLYINSYERTQQRLLYFLVWLAKKFGQTVNEGKLIDIPLTHEAIADSVGSTRVTITRLLKQFERERVINRQRRSIVLSKDVLLVVDSDSVHRNYR